jgi:hypothetical protein
MTLREEQPMTPNPTEMQVHQEFYGGYRISVFGEGSAWSFELSRTRFDLPIGPRSIFFKIANRSALKFPLPWADQIASF